MFDPSLSFLDGYFWFFKEAPGLDILIILFIAGYLLLARSWKRHKDRWSTPSFLFYAMLPLAAGLIFANDIRSFSRIERLLSGSTANLYMEMANGKIILILFASLSLLFLILRLLKTRKNPQDIPYDDSQSEAPANNRMSRLGVGLSLACILLTSILIAGDMFFFNVSNLFLDFGPYLETYKTHAHRGQAGLMVMSFILLLTLLLSMAAWSWRFGRCRPTPRQEQALRTMMVFLLGVILLFTFHCFSQSFYLSRIIVPF